MTDFDRVIDRHGTGSLKWNRFDPGVIPLWVADMDFASPPEVIHALEERARHGVFGYTMPYDEIEREVVDYLARRHDIVVAGEWLCWMPGLVPALNLACRAFAGPGEGVMTATPVYPPFLSAPPYSGRELQAVPLRCEDAGWTFDLEAMEGRVTPSTRVFILCNPHNPVGRVYTRAELEGVLAFCERHDLVLISDEIHSDLLLDDDGAHVPTLRLGERAAERTVTLMAPSKTYNLPGLACAYAVIPNPRLRAAFKKTARGLITEVNAFGYTGCAAAYRYGEPWRRELIRYLRGNRDALYAFVQTRLPHVRMWPMAATYLAWMDVTALGRDQPVSFFAEHGVGLSDGADFGAPGFVRLNFGCPRAVMIDGLERMAGALA
jgi:cystathionine beta-lyase